VKRPAGAKGCESLEEPLVPEVDLTHPRVLAASATVPAENDSKLLQGPVVEHVEFDIFVSIKCSMT
jgi:hypothetical protein